MAMVQTVNGAIDTADLGWTLMHEHIMTRSPGVYENWPHLFDRDAALAIAERKLTALYERGVRTLVDLTTVDLGRDIEIVQRVAERSPVQIIVATGVWWQPPMVVAAWTPDQLAELFIRDITVGIGTSGVRAAIIKCATDRAGVTREIETVLRASARAHKATGAPISTHTWAEGRMGEAQQAIFAEEGVDLRNVIIGHSGDTEDLDYLRGMIAKGSTLGMDRFGLEGFLSTEKRVAVVAALCAEGYADKLVLSHDANCWNDRRGEDQMQKNLPLWHFCHIPDDILPALRAKGVTEAQIDQMMGGNPRATFERAASSE